VNAHDEDLVSFGRAGRLSRTASRVAARPSRPGPEPVDLFHQRRGTPRASSGISEGVATGETRNASTVLRRFLDHEVDVERELGARATARDERRARTRLFARNVRHHVEVERVGAGALGLANRLAQRHRNLRSASDGASRNLRLGVPRRADSLRVLILPSGVDSKFRGDHGSLGESMEKKERMDLRQRCRASVPCRPRWQRRDAVVIVVVGAPGTGVQQSRPARRPRPATRPSKACEPKRARVCRITNACMTVTLRAPSRRAAGQPNSFPATVPTSDGTVSSWSFILRRRNNVTTASGSTTHTFTTQVPTSSRVTRRSGRPFTTTSNRSSSSRSPPPTLPPLWNTPGVRAAFWATRAGRPPVRPLSCRPAETVTVTGSYTGAPTNPLYTLGSPTIKVAPGGTGTPPTPRRARPSGRVSFRGTYWSPSSASPTGRTARWRTKLHLDRFSLLRPASTPARRRFNGLEPAQGSARRLRVTRRVAVGDPAIDYETVGTNRSSRSIRPSCVTTAARRADLDELRAADRDVRAAGAPACRPS